MTTAIDVTTGSLSAADTLPAPFPPQRQRRPESRPEMSPPPRKTAIALRSTDRGDNISDMAPPASPSASSEPIVPEVPAPRQPSDYPAPAVLTADEEVEWDAGADPFENYRKIGRRLAKSGDLFRNSRYAGGLMMASPCPSVPPTPITDAATLMAVIADRVRVVVRKDGEVTGNTIPANHLRTMLASEAFLQEFSPLDLVTTTPMYIGDFQLTAPGYNNLGPGQRVFYAGPDARISHSLEAITKFLDIMPFASVADRTNTVAAALTVKLRNRWPGAKPTLSVTANKSHAGKDTIVTFAVGSGRSTSISYQNTDWALERSFIGALSEVPDTAVLNVENARLQRGDLFISSAFLERYITDPEPVLFSTGTGGPTRRTNNLVVAITTNFGSLSTDLMNRRLPIHLEWHGNVGDRKSPIGNPKLEYLPQNAAIIEAELCGMVEKWKTAGCPRDLDAHHPFTEWAQIVGGILQVNGFPQFLANYSERNVVQDPVRHALGLLGAERPDTFMRAAEWAELAVDLGVSKVLIGAADHGSEKGRERGMGVMLSAHRDENFDVVTEDYRCTVALEHARRRFEPKKDPTTRYQFKKLSCQPLPSDPDPLV